MKWEIRSYPARKWRRLTGFERPARSFVPGDRLETVTQTGSAGRDFWIGRGPGGKWQWVKTNSTPVVHIKIAGKWMFIPLKMVLIGIDPYPNQSRVLKPIWDFFGFL